MPNVARVGDTGSHGGEISTGSDDTLTDGRKTARKGDIYDCDIHGPNPIVGCSTTVFVDGRGIVRIGDATSCGAVITSGSDDVFAGG